MAISFPVRNGESTSLPVSPRADACHTRALRVSALLALVWLLASVAVPNASATYLARKQEAREQFDKAEQMRDELDNQPVAQRTRKDYKRVADAYRRVYYLAPSSSKADSSIVAVAEILTEMGRQFQPGDKDLKAAIAQYEFLRREYPGSKYRMQALFTTGQIYQKDLGDAEAARNAYEEFLRRYPRNTLAPQATAALAELNQPAPLSKTVETVETTKPVAAEIPKAIDERTPDKTEIPASSEAFVPVTGKKLAELPVVTGIRHWSTPDYTRVAIDVDSEVKYEAGRVPNPDRIFFDLPNTRLAANLTGKSFDIGDSFLKKIRVAQYQPGYTRVVLEVADVSDYSAFLLPNPYRLIIDIHGRPRQPVETASNKAEPGPAGVTEITHEKSYRSVEKANEAGRKSTTPDDSTSTADSSPPAGRKAGHRVVVDNEQGSTNPATVASTRKRDNHTKTASTSSADTTNDDDEASADSSQQTGDPLFAGPRDGSGPELKATTEPTTAPTAVAVAPRAKTAKNQLAAAPPHEAEPTSFGDRSLTRALGLKIGRIVIDAGHGGHDTGTIGPDGLMEKDVVLDVALRLGRLLENRLGADVIYTRKDDTFIPLETRTAIANEHQADLFVSIHANSSEDPDARGVETYYLNFTSDPGALDVAARENALSQKSVFQLQELVKKITLKDKIEESHELATDVQQSLYAGLAGRHATTLKDRGVKKAPFVVLIGANMPSILAEISFVSNPTDEEKMSTPEYRQKIAESIYKGIAKYANGLSGVKVASKFSKEAGQ